MPATVEEIKKDLQSLSALQRAELARFLIESLDQEQDPDAEAAWDMKLERRFNDINSGKAQGMPAAEGFATIRESYA